MQPLIRNEKRTLTPEKGQKILANYGTSISLEKAEFLLDFLYKTSNLSVSEAILRAVTQEKKLWLKRKKDVLKTKNDEDRRFVCPCQYG
ncbi:MAG: hypothetical protein JWR09_2757 [Mucilaginibacter sp.]|nr:hypothetical protein [Mucilaginibacter sp.]